MAKSIVKKGYGRLEHPRIVFDIDKGDHIIRFGTINSFSEYLGIFRTVVVHRYINADKYQYLVRQKGKELDENLTVRYRKSNIVTYS